MQDLESTGPSVGKTTAFLVVFFGTIYASTHHRFKTEKQKAYILSTISSGCMSLLSLWFVAAWIRGTDGGGRRCGFEVLLEERVDSVARLGTVFFRSYLIADVSALDVWIHAGVSDLGICVQLLVGTIAYPKQMGLLTGWVHHLAYLGIMVHLDTTSYAGLFMLAAVMEVPTFHLGLSTLWPSRFRHDLAFLVLFLFTRIIFHSYLIATFTISATILDRLPWTNSIGKTGRNVVGSWVPGGLLVAAFPMHGMWFLGGVKGYLRRRRARAQAAETSMATTEEPGMPSLVADDGKFGVRSDTFPRSMGDTMNKGINDFTDSPASNGTESLAASSPRETPLLTPYYALAALAGSDEQSGFRGYFEDMEGKAGGGLGLVVDGGDNERGI